MDLNELLQFTVAKGASDLHIIPGYYPTVRINNELYPLRNFPMVTGEDSQKLAFVIVSPEQKELLIANHEMDMGYAFEDVRFRINIYYVNKGIALSLRTIPAKIQTIEQLMLPPLFHEFAQYRQGLVLVTGPTGEGKSTSLAAIINEVNLKSARHILTIEDPIEFVYPPGLSIISQRQLNEDTHSWTASLKSAMREDPDVILIGEMRDYDTIQAAITLAETGHLVFSTLHTSSAPETINRIIDVFPSHQQNQIRNQLSTTLKAVVAQRLVPAAEPNKRIAVLEILLNTPAVAATIRDGRVYMLENVLITGEDAGMVLFEKYLARLYQTGKVSRNAALAYAIRPNVINKFIQ